MKKSVFPAVRTAYLCYLAFVTLLLGGFRAGGLVLRQRFAWLLAAVAIAGLFVMLALWRAQRRAAGRKTQAVTALLIAAALATCLAVPAHLLLFADRESVAVVDGQRKIKVETEFFILYDVTYHDYVNPFWYRQFPCVQESYDDGDPDDLVYTDYYDAAGTLTKRVFADEE